MPPVVGAIGSFIAGAAAALGAAPLSLTGILGSGAYAAGYAAAGALASAVGALGVGGVIALGGAVAGLFISAPQTPQAALPSSQRQIVRQAVGYRRKGWGTALGGGQLLFAGVKGSSSRWPGGNNYCMLVAFADGRVSKWRSFLVDGKEVADETGEVSVDEYTEYLRFHARNGTENQTAFDHLIAEFPETVTEHWRGIGTALIAAELRCTNDVYAIFPNAYRTELGAIADLSPVYDQRDPTQVFAHQATWKFSRNAALVIQNQLTSPLRENGLAIPVDILDLEDFAAAADDSDREVAGPEGQARKQWELSGWGSYSETPAAILKRMMVCCDARLRLTSNGKIGIGIGGWQEPTVTLTDQDFLEITQTRGRLVSGTGTVIKSRYTSPDHGYLEQDAIEYVHPAAATYGREVTTADFLMASNHGQVRHLQKSTAYRQNAEIEVECVTGVTGLAVVGERYICIRSELEGIEGTFEVSEDWEYLINEHGNFIGVKFTAISMAREGVEYDELTEGVTPPEVLASVESSIAPDTPTLLISGSALRQYFEISQSDTSYVHQIEIVDVTDPEDLQTGYLWLEPGQLSSSAVLEDGHEYEIRAKARTVSGLSSPYTDAQTITVSA
ncbi:hypothetical protein [Pseudovibrio sp. SPO723]|uniref:hypothetical protein n=1 Tax=Nesiotobacter zosterae TaxID=392721 RepID=UPI0029C3AF60|nr:hypothetical protein [Pseudovibrio sp. SPO723]MDX5595661.1 hypothetical protein [Pseudovibrio sp. SPO723]